MNNKTIPFSQLAASLSAVGADGIEGITVEQVTQIHNAVNLGKTINELTNEIKCAAENDAPVVREVLIDKLSNIHMSLTSLCTSLVIPVPEVNRAATAKITANNQPTKPKQAVKKKEVQTDIEDVK